MRGARAGERAAVERLYAGHVASARRLATILAGPAGADALVAESFARAFGQVRAGRGPSMSFRPLLLTTMRDLHRSAGGTYVRPTEPASGPELDAVGATAALADLPGNWQQVLWHTDVESRSAEEVAELLGVTPASVTSTVDRARDRLQGAYLDHHGAAASVNEHCQWTRKRLGRHVRGDLGRRPSAKVAEHLNGCSACKAARTEVEGAQQQLADSLVPVVLVGAMGLVEAAVAAAPAPVPAGAS
ncbi:MAG TPA: sigma-70 family RNA polymerase sigma factor, partial [Nocardioides sp.]|nr:sigma-70 family RNA polymerase sigma factor [Nocardioides sp.]